MIARFDALFGLVGLARPVDHDDNDVGQFIEDDIVVVRARPEI
jgi:hypothetical protein